VIEQIDSLFAGTKPVANDWGSGCEPTEVFVLLLNDCPDRTGPVDYAPNRNLVQFFGSHRCSAKPAWDKR
jgi:hypothetical protein